MKSGIVWVPLVALMLTTLAQEATDPLAEWRAFRSSLNNLHDREYDRALPELERLKSSSITEIAARAHMEIGVYYMDQKQDPERALRYLTEIVSNKKYLPLSNIWANAVSRVARIKLGRAVNRQQIQEAQNDFDLIYKTYPDTAVSAGALFHSAQLSERLQDYDGAMEKYQRIKREFSNSLSTPQALYNLAIHYIFKGDLKSGLVQFQEIRSQFPDRPESERALHALTGLHRYYRRTLMEDGRGIIYRAPQEISLSDIKELTDPYSLLVNDAEELYMVDRYKKYAFKFRRNGKVLQTLQASDPSALAAGPEGDLYVAERDAVRKLQGKNPPSWKLTRTDGKGEKRPLRRVGAFAVDRFGDIFAVDAEERQVVKYFVAAQRGELFPPQENLRHVRELTIDVLNNIYLLDEKENVISVHNSLGEPLGQIRLPGSGSAGRGGAVALTTDALNHLYVLDRSGSFYLYELRYPSPKKLDAQFLTSVSFTNKFKDSPQTIAVSRQGRVFISAKKSGSVLVFH